MCTEPFEVTILPDEREEFDEDVALEEEGKNWQLREQKEEEEKKRGPPDLYFLSRFIPCPLESNSALTQGCNIRFSM